jgi:anti-sigma factor RsiW
LNGHHSHNGIDERTERDLAALADGSLSGRRRETIEARLAESPELAAALERQRASVAALSALRGELAAPARLRTRIEAERSRPSAPVRRRRLAFAGGLAGAAAAAALAAVLILPSGAGGPTVTEAAQLAELPATEASVPVDPANPKRLATRVEGVPFPNLEGEFGWRQAGERSDELDGRDTKTVFYEREGQRIGYTILSGDAIDPPEGSTPTTLNDVALNSIKEDGQEIVTWLREDRTCVLSGEGVSRQELLTLASWKGEGAVPF